MFKISVQCFIKVSLHINQEGCLKNGHPFVKMEENPNLYITVRETEGSVATMGKQGRQCCRKLKRILTQQFTEVYTLKELKTDVWTGCVAQTSLYTGPGFESLQLPKIGRSTKNLSTSIHRISHNSKKKQSKCSDKQDVLSTQQRIFSWKKMTYWHTVIQINLENIPSPYTQILKMAYDISILVESGIIQAFLFK